jgi:anti-anti-sigma factor
MALTMLPPSAATVARVRFARMIPEVHAEGTRSVVALRGEADISTRQVMCDVLCRVIADGTGDVVVDLAKATFVDTAIVRVLATAQQLLHRQDRILTLRAPSTLATRVLTVFGLTDLIETEEPVRR